MKLATFESNGRLRTAAMVQNGSTFDVTDAGTVIEIISSASARAKAEGIVSAGQSRLSGQPKLRAPFTPRSFICIGLNYMDHVKESNSLSLIHI